jgi:hypothetical protein
MSEQERRQGMSEARLERRYRRLLACYPRAYRRQNEEEILAVLRAGAHDGQQRPGLAASADLIKGAVRMRLWPAARMPRTVLARVAARLSNPYGLDNQEWGGNVYICTGPRQPWAQIWPQLRQYD